MSNITILLSIVIVLINMQLGDAARGMWGAKRKRKDEEDAEPTLDFIESQVKAVESQRKTQLKKGTYGGSLSANKKSTEIAELFESYISMMEKMIDTPDFEDMLNAEGLLQMFSAVPGVSGNPEIAKLLSSPEFQNPAFLKMTIVNGIQVMRQYANEFIEAMNDPQLLQQFLAQLPAEYSEAIQQFIGGDLTGMKSLIASLPGVSTQQQKMLLNLLEGDAKGAKDSVDKLLSDPDEIEKARQQFLADPSMAEMIGVPNDVLTDKKKWAAYMEESKKALQDGSLGEEEVGLDNIFGASMAA